MSPDASLYVCTCKTAIYPYCLLACVRVLFPLPSLPPLSALLLYPSSLLRLLMLMKMQLYTVRKASYTMMCIRPLLLLW